MLTLQGLPVPRVWARKLGLPTAQLTQYSSNVCLHLGLAGEIEMRIYWWDCKTIRNESKTKDETPEKKCACLCVHCAYCVSCVYACEIRLFCVCVHSLLLYGYALCLSHCLCKCVQVCACVLVSCSQPTLALY